MPGMPSKVQGPLIAEVGEMDNASKRRTWRNVKDWADAFIARVVVASRVR